MKYSFDAENHIHTLDGVALSGTSSISKVIGIGSALSWWASGKALELFGWTPTKTKKSERLETAREYFNDIHDISTVEEYLGLLDLAYKNHKVKLDDSADKGIDLHADLENFVKCEMGLLPAEDRLLFNDRITPFIEWSKKNVKRFLCSEGYCYSEKLWVGGIVDVVAELNDSSIAIIDFKSAKEVYMSHLIQCAGYKIQIEENGIFDASGGLVLKLDRPITKLIICPFGAKKVSPVENTLPIDEYVQGFKDATGLYRLLGKEKEAK
jgi:hypothetical protein